MKKIKNIIVNILLRIFGVNLLRKVLYAVRASIEKIKGAINSFFIYIPIFNPLFSLIYKKMNRENFDRFLNHKDNFEKFVVNSGAKQMFVKSAENKIYFLVKIREHAKKINRHDLVPTINECILAYDPNNQEARQNLAKSYTELVESSFEKKDIHAFEYYVSKIKPLDPVFARFYELVARNQAHHDVTTKEWEHLLEEAKVSQSNLTERISSHIHQTSL